MTNYTSAPFTISVPTETAITPTPVVGVAGDYLTFFSGSSYAAASMVVNQYYQIVSPSTTTWSSYGTLQAIPNGNGISGATGAVYLCTSLPTAGTPGTVFPLPLNLTGAIATNTAFFGLTAGATLVSVVAQVQAINALLLAYGLSNV